MCRANLDSIRQEIETMVELKINQQQIEIERQGKLIARLTDQVNQQREEINQQRDEINQQRDEINQQRYEINRSGLDLENTTNFVIFSAYTTDPQDPDAGDVITFPNIYVNAGEGYDTTTSTFTCPTTGFYYIYFNVRVDMADTVDGSRDQCLINIRMDGSIMATVSRNPFNTSSSSFFSTSFLLLHCSLHNMPYTLGLLCHKDKTVFSWVANSFTRVDLHAKFFFHKPPMFLPDL